MKVEKVIDAIVLSALKEGRKSADEVEKRSGLEKRIAAESLSKLRRHGLISNYRINGRSFYSITNSGENAIENVFRGMGKI